MSWFKFSLRPKEKRFFILFEQGAITSVKIAEQLRDMVRLWENVKERVQVMEDLEHDGDAITHEIMNQLHRSFITPFDREDISMLAQALDDVTDSIYATADSMYLYKVSAPTKPAIELTVLLSQATLEVRNAVSGLGDRINQNKLLRQCVEVNRIENECNSIYRTALVELFAQNTDTASLIKWREIYQHMEDAIDNCEDVANVLEGIALKYA